MNTLNSRLHDKRQYIVDRMVACHESLSRLMGDQFAERIQQPIQLLQAVMRQQGLSVVEAAQLLIEDAVAADPHGSASVIMWLLAAAVEMAEGVSP